MDGVIEGIGGEVMTDDLDGMVHAVGNGLEVTRDGSVGGMTDEGHADVMVDGLDVTRDGKTDDDTLVVGGGLTAAAVAGGKPECIVLSIGSCCWRSRLD